jgi:hypothetical protein
VELEGRQIMTGVARSRHLRRWIIGGVTGLALLLVGGFVFLVAVGMHVRAHDLTVGVLTGMDSSAATEPVTVTMGKVVLRIPRNYFMAMPNHDIRGVPDGVEFILLGLMPDFEPRTAANHPEFDDFHGFGRKLDVHVTYKGHTKTGKDLFLAFYKSKGRRPGTNEEYYARGPVTDAEFGYKYFKWLGDDELFHGTIDDPKDFIQCSSKVPGGPPVVPPEKPHPYYPFCEKTVLVGDDIVAQFSFSRDFLGNVPEIESRLIDVLNRFRVSGPALQVIQ